MSKKLFAICASFVAAVMLAGPGVPAAESCASGTDGGEWRNFGRDLANTRNQPDEHVIGSSNVRNLTLAWSVTTAQLGVSGGFNNTPLVADGCLYLATSGGWVVSLNAESRAINWKTKYTNGNSEPLTGSIITGSPAIGATKVYVGVGKTGGPYVAALDRATGNPLWTKTLDTLGSSYLVAGPQLFDPHDAAYPEGLIFQGFIGKEAQPTTARGGYMIVDAATGAEVKKGYTISNADYAAGHRGASIWGVAAIDETNLYAYAPTGNPASRFENPNANAIIKIDVNPARPDTFGTIVGSYHGLPDNYVAAVDLYNQAACQATNGAGAVWAQTCGQQDLDFGGAPSLFTVNGVDMVGDLQKAGVYHAIKRADMTKAWTATVGTPEFFGNSTSGAVADGRVYTFAQQPGQLVGLAQGDGLYNWASPLLDGIHYNAVSTANGVVYTGDSAGNLRAYDAALGVPLLVRSLTLDTGGNGTDFANSSGIAIARHTVYYGTTNGMLAAYRLPAA